MEEEIASPALQASESVARMREEEEKLNAELEKINE